MLLFYVLTKPHDDNEARNCAIISCFCNRKFEFAGTPLSHFPNTIDRFLMISLQYTNSISLVDIYYGAPEGCCNPPTSLSVERVRLRFQSPSSNVLAT